LVAGVGFFYECPSAAVCEFFYLVDHKRITKNMKRMQGLLFGTILAATFVAFASPAFAVLIALNQSTSGTFTASCASTTTCSLSTSAGGVSGATSTGGSYTFTGMNVTLDACTAANGCTTFVSGTGGMLTVNGTLYNPITVNVLDGDGSVLDFTFSAAGLSGPNDVTLDTTTTFNTLLTGAPSSVTAGVSSGEVNTAPPAPRACIAQLAGFGTHRVGLAEPSPSQDRVKKSDTPELPAAPSGRRLVFRQRGRTLP
jgi:hypothetical protein